MCTALMFALYPTCKAIIIHASWQSQAPSLLHLQLFALGYDMTVRLISPLLHIPLPASPFLSVFLHSDCAPCLNLTLIWRLGKSFTSQARVTPLLLWCVWRSTHVSAQVCFVQECFSHHFSYEDWVKSRSVKSNQRSVLGISKCSKAQEPLLKAESVLHLLPLFSLLD